MSRRGPEAELTEVVLDLARMGGWSWAHVPTLLHQRRDRRAPGGTVSRYKTAIEGPLGRGFPDLLLARAGQLLFAELKAAGAYPSPAQREVHALLAAAGHPVAIWRPADLEAVAALLVRRP